VEGWNIRLEFSVKHERINLKKIRYRELTSTLFVCSHELSYGFVIIILWFLVPPVFTYLPP
jgi:hypothetical protein